MYNLLKKEKNARRGIFTTVHGSFETPAFMNIATAGAVKGGLSSDDILKIGCQIMLCNTYHLHIRPGDEIIRTLGGLSGFTGWKRPILTDSGGFQIYSLASQRKINEDGVAFRSHIDGNRVFIGPEESMQIQSNLGSSIAMAFDECIAVPSGYNYVKQSCERTVRWLSRCISKLDQLNSLDTTLNKQQMLFGINQGACYEDIRIENMKRISEMKLDGYAIGGLAVGEAVEDMYRIISVVEEHMPEEKPRYLMGVGTPVNILEGVSRGIDMFDCVLPSRNGRHGHFYTWEGIINILNEKYETDDEPIDKSCECEVCRGFSRGYIRHLFKAREILALRFGVIHNLFFYNSFLKRVQEEIDNGTFESFRKKYIEILDNRV